MFWTFLIGAASLSALPLVTAGFYSKDMILMLSWVSVSGSPWLWAGGVAGAFLTALYSFRLVFRVFFGPDPGRALPAKSSFSIQAPLVALAVLSVLGGFVQMPAELGGYSGFAELIQRNFPAARIVPLGKSSETFLFAGAILAPLIGIWLAWFFFLRKRPETDRLARSGPGLALHQFWHEGWGFDRLYHSVVTGPFIESARMNRDDFIDFFYHRLAGLSVALNGALVASQSGRLRTYAMVLTAGVIVMVVIVLLV